MSTAAAPILTYALPKRRHPAVQFILHQPLGAAGLVQTGDAVARDQGTKTLLFQVKGHQLCQGFFILDNQYGLHALSS